MNTKLNLTDDQSKIVQAYSVLDQISSTGGSNTTFQMVVDGKPHEISATPQIIQAFKQSLGFSLFERTNDQPLSLSRTQVAQGLHVEPQVLDGLVAKQTGGVSASSDTIPLDQIMPWLSQQSGFDQRSENRVS